MCEHEFVGTGYSLYPKEGLRICKLCQKIPAEIELESKLASAEKALADEKEAHEVTAWKAKSGKENQLMFIDKWHDAKERAEQAEAQAAAMRQALTEIAHYQPRELTDAVDMREIARAALASSPSAGREALKEEI